MGHDGWDLVLAARRESLLQELAEELSPHAGVTVLPCDLSKENAARTLVEKLSAADIVVDVLVNNAGLGDHSLFVDSDWEKNRAMMRVNIESLTELTRLLVPSMISRGGGFVLNVASVASFQPGPFMAIYYATKAYVLALSEALAEELRENGIVVTALCPGPTRSGFQGVANLGGVKAMNNRFMPSSESVARFGYRSLMRGKRVAVHGFAFRIMLFVSRFLPRIAVVKAVARYQSHRSA